MAVRNWRQIRPGQHTKEVVRSETLSPEAKALLLAQQKQLDTVNAQVAALKEALAGLMGAIRDADAERKRGAA